MVIATPSLALSIARRSVESAPVGNSTLTNIGRGGSRASDAHEPGAGDLHHKYASKRDRDNVWQMVD